MAVRQQSLKLPTESPRIQRENKDRWNENRSKDNSDFFTVGYMGRTIHDLVESLRAASVRTVVDVRHAAVSMYRPEFSKRNLETHLADAGISYLHLPHLGVPREIRNLATDYGHRHIIWDWYDDNVAGPYIGRNLTDFLNQAEHPVALLCVELDPTACHRHRLSALLEQQGLRGFDL